MDDVRGGARMARLRLFEVISVGQRWSGNEVGLLKAYFFCCEKKKKTQPELAESFLLRILLLRI